MEQRNVLFSDFFLSEKIKVVQVTYCVDELSSMAYIDEVTM